MTFINREASSSASESFDFARPRSTPPSPSFMRPLPIEPCTRESVNGALWPRKKSSEFHPPELSRLLELNRNIHSYDPEDFEEIKCLQQRIRQTRKSNQKMSLQDLRLYKTFCKLFEASYLEAQSKALVLHQLFTEAFYSDTSPTYHRETGIITLNYDQLDFVQRLLKQAFPGFFALAESPMQNQQIAHLAHIVLLGENSATSPPSAEVIEIREIGWKWEREHAHISLIEQQKYLLDKIASSANPFLSLSAASAEGVDLLDNLFIRGPNMLAIGEFSTDKLKEKKFFAFLNEFILTIVKHINKVESEFPGRTAAETKIFYRSLAYAFSLDYDTQNIVKEGLLYLPPSISRELGRLSHLYSSAVPCDEQLLETVIALKFLELALFVRLRYDEAIHSGLNRFYESYIADSKEKNGKETLIFRPTMLTYRFDASLKPIACEMYHQMITISSRGELRSCEDANTRSVVGTIFSTLEFKTNQSVRLNQWPRNLFYIDTSFTIQENIFNQCLWNWRAPKKLMEDSLEKICPEYYGKSIKQQWSKFIFRLKQLASLKANDQLSISEGFSLSITTPAQGGWFNPLITYLLPSSSSSAEKEESYEESEKMHILAERLKAMIDDGMGVYKEYTRRQRLIPQNDDAQAQMISYQQDQLAQLLKSAIEGLRQLEAEELHPLIRWIEGEHLSPFLSSSSLIDHSHPSTGVVALIKNGILESNNGHDIDWKVNRYQSMLRQLRSGIAPIVAETFHLDLEDPIPQFLSMKFEHAGMTELQTHISNLFHLVDLTIVKPEQFTQYYLKSLRDAYALHFIGELRNCIATLAPSADTYPEAIHCIRKICCYLYTEIHLEKECIALNEKFYKMGSKYLTQPPLEISGEFDQMGSGQDQGSNSYLTERIDALHDSFHATGSEHKIPDIRKWGKSIKDHWNFGFDPNTEGNLPHRLGEILIKQEDSKREVRCIACGSATVEGWLSYARENPEFYEFIKEYQDQGKCHLFVINQDLREGSWFKRLKGGVETDRINVLLGMAEGFEETFFPIVLSKNSSFYKQNGEFEHLSNARSFKQELVRQHFKSEPSVSGNYIPSHVIKKIDNIIGTPEGLMKQSIAWIRFIHSCMFYNKSVLTVEERQIFYDLYQDILVLYLIVTLNTDSWNISCKDAIDRAADSNSRLWAHLGLVHGMEREPLFRERYEAYLLSRAIMTRKRETIPERVERNKQSVQYYESHKKRLGELHQKIFQTVSIFPVNPKELR